MPLVTVCAYFVELLYNGLNSFGGVRAASSGVSAPQCACGAAPGPPTALISWGRHTTWTTRIRRKAAHGAGVDRGDGGAFLIVSLALYLRLAKVNQWFGTEY